MIEAVGARYLPNYFATCAARLAPGGQMLLQGIVLPEYRYRGYLRSADFVQRYVFPGGALTSLGAIAQAIGAGTDLSVLHVEDLSPHYARTLRLWREAFLDAPRRRPPSRLRRALRPPVGVLPGLLRSRLRRALHQRRADAADPAAAPCRVSLGRRRRARRAPAGVDLRRQDDDRSDRVSLPTVLLAGAIAAAALMAALWLVQRRTHNAGIVDVAWSFATGGLGAAFALAGDGAWPRRLVVAGLAAAWGLRLGAAPLGARRPARPRTAATSRCGASGARTPIAGCCCSSRCRPSRPSLFALPMLAAGRNAAPLGLARRRRYRRLADRARRRGPRRSPAGRVPRRLAATAGRVCQAGLWRYSRHPNYFFEWLHWWGYVALAVHSPLWWVPLAGVAAMGYTITRVTGIPPTEAQAIRSRGDAYRAYQRTTSAFVPWPPRPDPQRRRAAMTRARCGDPAGRRAAGCRTRCCAGASGRRAPAGFATSTGAAAAGAMRTPPPTWSASWRARTSRWCRHWPTPSTTRCRRRSSSACSARA